MLKRTGSPGAGTPIVWSRIVDLMLTTVFGMWHSTQALPALSARWRVCAMTFAPISWWHFVQSTLLGAPARDASCGFLSTSGRCGLVWHVVQVAPPRRKHWLSQSPMASLENRRGRPAAPAGGAGDARGRAQ